ncbi:MAG: tetratricopeptide repeat protein [Cyclobacteriaceae bacterium]|jgi:tetratricopeptide (TPR) repeat protein|nr:tetratricopeptide repeat protein [Cyclobacteriaceae bacterium]
MNETRLTYLRQCMADDPEDPFAFYALALELAPTQPREALALHRQVAERFPDYLPNYYHLALLCLREGQATEALHAIDRGAAVARTQRNLKTLAELENLRDETA